MTYDIPGASSLELETIILDLNGTLSVGGKLVQGVHERIQKLKNMGFKILFFTGNTRNDAQKLADILGIEWILAKNAADKRTEAEKLNPKTCVSIGNGLIDLELMQVVGLRIVTLQAEGVHIKTMNQSDIIVSSINDALDLFIDPERLVATLRT